MIKVTALLRNKPTIAMTADELPNSADDFRIWPYDFVWESLTDSDLPMADVEVTELPS
jgi:hypothetical protein